MSLFSQMESRQQHSVVGGKVGKIKESSVDPPWLVAQLVEEEEECAANAAKAPEQPGELVLKNGENGAFHTLIFI